MNWIKKNPAQSILAVIAVLLLGGAFMVFSSVGQFSTEVVAKPPAPPNRADLPKPDLSTIDKAIELLNKPEAWKADKALFVSRQYVLDNNQLTAPDDGMFNPPVPNKWLLKYGLDTTDPNSLTIDSDGDGFSNLLEYLGTDTLPHLTTTPPFSPATGPSGPLADDSTDPTDPKVHPPYFTRLQVADIVSIPFRLKFMSYDMLKDQIDSVMVNPMDAGGAGRGRTNILKIGDKIANTTYKVERFERKIVRDANNLEVDVSELTVVNTATGTVVVLPLGKVINSPESYVSLRYLWVATGGKPTDDMDKRKGDTFSLPPENDKQYKVVEIKPEAQNAGKVTAGKVTILLPSGQNLVLPFPAAK